MTIGDFVHAQLDGQVGGIQGVYVRDLGNGVIEVQGQLEKYRCLCANAVMIADPDIQDEGVRRFVREVRRDIGVN